MNKRPMILLSIVERDKGKNLVKELENANIKVNIQSVGFGTAPTEMLDIFGLGTIDKDIVISIAPENVVKKLMANFSDSIATETKHGGLMMVLKVCAVSRVLTQILDYEGDKNSDKGDISMKNEHQNNLIFIAVNEGYSGEVMQVARKAGATGGTVIKGRLCDIEMFAQLGNTQIDEEREILLILAPQSTSSLIMDDVNKQFGLTSDANGIIFAIPTEKAYKI